MRGGVDSLAILTFCSKSNSLGTVCCVLSSLCLLNPFSSNHLNLEVFFSVPIQMTSRSERLLDLPNQSLVTSEAFALLVDFSAPSVATFLVQFNDIVPLKRLTAVLLRFYIIGSFPASCLNTSRSLLTSFSFLGSTSSVAPFLVVKFPRRAGF